MTKLLLAALLLTCSLSGQPITYHGGRVMVQPRAYVVWYCSPTEESKSMIRNMLIGMTGSGYMQGLSGYYDFDGDHVQPALLFGGEHSSCIFGQTITTVDVPRIVADAILTRGWPSDPQAVYAVFAARGIVATPFVSAWHFQMPAPRGEGFQIAGQFSNEGGGAGKFSHELVGAITDPLSDGWFDANGMEASDKCGYTYSWYMMSTGVFYLANYWTAGGTCTGGSSGGGGGTPTPPPVCPPGKEPVGRSGKCKSL